LLNEEYLLVADYNQHIVYQLQLDNGELRGLPTTQCYPVSLAFDPSIKDIYFICDERDLYRIHKKTLDGKIDTLIYSATQSTFAQTVVSIRCRNSRHLNSRPTLLRIRIIVAYLVT